jgi:hypothetical protein
MGGRCGLQIIRRRACRTESGADGLWQGADKSWRISARRICVQMKNLKTSNLDRVLKILDGNTRGFKSPTKSIAELLDEIDQQVAVITEDSNEAHAAACQAYCFDQELALIESGVSIEDAVLMVDLDVLQAVGI